jgi:hypothetical protein
MLPEIAKGNALAKVLSGERRSRARQQHLPAVRDVRDARRAMDVDPDVVRARLAAGRRAFPGVHAHANSNDRVVGEAGRSESMLRRGSRTDRLGRAVEDDEEGIALDPHLRPGRERGAESLRVRRKDLVITVRAELVQELRRALDVGEQEGDGPARQTSVVHLWIVRS